MAAMLVQYAELVGAGSEDDEVFTKQSRRKWKIGDLRRQCQRLPEAAQLLAARRALVGQRQFFVDAVGPSDFISPERA
jgi:hypothetical protein